MSVAGIVPAAGRSTRMGTPKPLLDAGGRSFLQAVVGALSRGGCAPVLVVLRERSGPVAAMAGTAGARIVVNPDPSAGPVSSLRAGIRALEEAEEAVDGVAFCPVDHPLVEPDTVERLLGAFRAGDAPAVVPAHGGRRGHPVFFRRTLFAELLGEELEEGARTVLHRHLEEV
ncbi:MAG TPA: nucleotidyltransferase family protein, partial [Longimicrobiales bacterium]|nr:nucleotidyltransferase family protein [Longimicrobiales bacterium]